MLCRLLDLQLHRFQFLHLGCRYTVTEGRHFPTDTHAIERRCYRLSLNLSTSSQLVPLSPFISDSPYDLRPSYCRKISMCWTLPFGFSEWFVPPPLLGLKEKLEVPFHNPFKNMLWNITITIFALLNASHIGWIGSIKILKRTFPLITSQVLKIERIKKSLIK